MPSGKKIDILKDIGLLTKHLYKKTENITVLRNKLAHETNKKILYNGKDIKQDKSVILDVAKDYDNIYNVLSEHIIRSFKKSR